VSALAVWVGVALATAPEQEHFLFEASPGWVMTDGLGRPVERFADFGGLRAVEADVSRDGERIVFTSVNHEASNTLLYLWRRGDAAPRVLDRPYGFHAQPKFSRDGEWVTFGHNPDKGGPPGRHKPGANSQLYRVRTDGTRLEMLTATRGCKLSPVTRDAFEFFFVHSSCDIGSALSSIDAGGREHFLTPYEANYDELTLAGDEPALVVTQKGVDVFSLVKVALPGGKKTLLYTGERAARAVHPAWSASAHAVLFQRGAELWSVGLDGVAKQLSTLRAK
jgi:hypothetical protein